jgi:hypothetical protein
LRGRVDAGVTYQAQFERYRHLGLVPLEIFSETPRVLAGRAEMDPRILAAFRSAVTDAPWPENKFTAGTAALDDLRGALEQAERFDQ